MKNPFAGCHVATSQIKLQRFGSVSKKLIVIGGSNNFLNEVRRIEAKMYLSETVGAAVAHFQFDNDGSLDIL